MRTLLFIILLPCVLLAQSEFSVSLKTQSNLQAIRIEEIQNKDASFSSSFLKEMKNVIDFDFNHNGYTQVINSKQSPYEIKMQYEERKLNAIAIDKQSNKIFRFAPIYLTGDLYHDREYLHKLSNEILKKLFSIEGIATTKILYSIRKHGADQKEEDPDWISEIWVCDYDGKNAKQITFDNHYNVSPFYIPIQSIDGYQNFVYVSYRKGQPKIYRASFKNPKGKSLFSLAGNQILPTVSPQHNMVAFVCDAAGRPDLFLQKYTPIGEPTGKPIQLFSYPRATQATASFSPDGSELAFVSDKDGPPRIYIMDVSKNQKNKRPDALLISKKNRYNSSPSWSPDGKKIAYTAKTEGIRQIWIYDIKTGEEKQITQGSENKENPKWAPNSLHLVYNTEDGIYTELYIVNLNHPNPVQITNGLGHKRFPCWEPRKNKRG